VGLIGCGRVAERGYGPAFAGLSGVRLAAVADPDPARRALVASDARGFDSAEELLASGEADAIVVATPPALHVRHAVLAASHDLPALVEKPPGLSVGDARALAGLEPQPWLGLNRRFEPGLAELVRRCAGENGLELRLVLDYRRRAWRPHGGGEDALLELGPHAVDLAAALAGAPLRVRATRVAWNRAEIELGLERGSASIRLAADRSHRETVEARADGRRLGAWFRGGILRSAAARIQPGVLNPLAASLGRQLEAFGRATRGGDPGPLAAAADGITIMAVLEAARRSIRAGGSDQAVHGRV
jgi:predicted dehydrogenase